MKKNTCTGNCPNVCKVHDGEFTFCTNSGCDCHGKAPIVTYMPRTWDWDKSALIDDDVKAELSGVPVFYGDIINLQLVKLLRRLLEKL